MSSQILDDLFAMSDRTTLSTNDKAQLRVVSRWARLLGVLGMVGVGLAMLLLVVGFGMNWREFDITFHFPVFVFSALSFVGLLLVFLFCRLIFSMGSHFQRGIEQNDSQSMSQAFRKLKLLFHILGILTMMSLIGGIIFILLIIFLGFGILFAR